MLKGLLFDDRGNPMSPSFSTKRGVRYRFYVSSAVIFGRHDEAGSVQRVSAPDVESGIISVLRERYAQTSGNLSDQAIISAHIERAIVSREEITITLKTRDATEKLVEIVRSRQAASPRARIETDNCQSIREPKASLLHALARAHLWHKALSERTYQSIEELALILKRNPRWSEMHCD